MSEKPRNTGLVRAGDSPLFRDLLKDVAAPAAPPLSRVKEKILDTAVAVQQEPDEYELAYMARELVQCTLPHSNPGDIPVWTRTNGNITLVIVRTAYDQKAQKLVGFPYGSIPRLLLFWMTTEALRTGSRRLELGGGATPVSCETSALIPQPAGGNAVTPSAFKIKPAGSLEPVSVFSKPSP